MRHELILSAVKYEYRDWKLRLFLSFGKEKKRNENLIYNLKKYKIYMFSFILLLNLFWEKELSFIFKLLTCIYISFTTYII